MKLSKMSVVNWRGIRELLVEFDPKMTVFHGMTGKTSILEAIRIPLSKAVSLINTSAGVINISRTDIHKEGENCAVHLDTDLFSVSRKSEGREKIDPKLRAYANSKYTGAFSKEGNVPVFVYYPAMRDASEFRRKETQSFLNSEFLPMDNWLNSLVKNTDFTGFFTWFAYQTTIENEQVRDMNPLVFELRANPMLEHVRRALRCFMADLRYVAYTGKVQKNPNKFLVEWEHLSHGEQTLLATIGDLAHRLVIANPVLENPLEGEGVVLIDELELHLHPSLHRHVICQLTQVFPNCQFILSTNSPLILGEVEGRCVRQLKYNSTSDNVECFTPAQALGLDVNGILQSMDATERNPETNVQLQAIAALIDEEKFAEAREQMGLLHKRLNGSIPELVGAETLILMLEDLEP
jgi:predicted ATP-binding protein involved in virulence